MHFVYLITNTVNGKKYVGITRTFEKRWEQHKAVARRGPTHHCFQAIHAAIAKYEASSFTYELLEACCSDVEAFEAEKRWIRQHESLGAGGYNLTSGGEGVSELSPESRKKIAESKLGDKNPSAQRKGKNHWRSGVKASPETRALQSERAKNRPPFSDEHRRKLAEKTKAYWAQKRAGLTST